MGTFAKMVNSRKIWGSFCLLLLFAIHSVAAVKRSSNFQPNIGVITQPSSDGVHTEIEASYIKFIEAGGGKAVPIFMEQPDNELYKLFMSINGVIFPGGAVKLEKGTRFYTVLELFFKWAIEANDKSDYFPVWGTCLGFQALAQIVSQNYSILTENVYEDVNVGLPLKWSKDFEKVASSAMLNLCSSEGTATAAHTLAAELKRETRLRARKLEDKNISYLMCIPGLFEATSHSPLAAYNHHDGVSLDDWKQNPELDAFFKLLATSVSVNDIEFAAVIESKNYPIYGTQFHPEKDNFLFTPEAYAQHSLRGSQFMQYFANFLVDEARKSEHRFPSKEEEFNSLIFQYSPFLRQRSKLDYDLDLAYLFPLNLRQSKEAVVIKQKRYKLFQI